MTKKFQNYQSCQRYLLKLRQRIQANRKKNSMMAYWRTYEIILGDLDDVISCMECSANEYIFTDSKPEYKEEISSYFGEEPIIDEDYVAMSCAYESLEDCEKNRRDVVIMVVDI